MVQTSEQVLAVTARQIAEFLQSANFGDRQLTLIVPIADENDLLPGPSNTIRDKAHLESLLLEAIASPKEPVTEQDWIDIRREVRERLAARKTTRHRK